jgi:hypothetical protein
MTFFLTQMNDLYYGKLAIDLRTADSVVVRLQPIDSIHPQISNSIACPTWICTNQAVTVRC